MIDQVDKWMTTIYQIGTLLPRCAETVDKFWSPDYGFRTVSGEGETSLASHSLSIEVSLLLEEYPGLQSTEKKARETQLRLFLTNSWNRSKRSEPAVYKPSMIIPVVTELKHRLTEDEDKLELRKKVMKAVGAFKVEVNRLHSDYLNETARYEHVLHAMILYRLRRALFYLEKYWIEPLSTIQPKVEKTIRDMEKKLDSYMESQLYFYMSMCSAIKYNEEDAMQLGYMLYALHQYSSFENDVVLDHGIELALNGIFGGGRTPRYQSIVRDEDTHISASPVHVITLLSRIQHVRRQFAKYSDIYNEAYEWLRSSERYDRFTTDTGNELDHDTPAWMAEPWRGVGKPEAWVNASVIEFFIRYRNLLREVCGTKLLVHFGASTRRPTIAWRELEPFVGYDELTNNLVLPSATALDLNRTFEKCSVILFGPPGTGKTSIAHAMAWRMRLPFIEILPHHFAAEGINRIIQRANDVFRKLLVMKRCLVLFNEVDEFVLSNNQSGEEVGKYITTSMLPWIQQLRAQAEIVFVFTTNQVQIFDEAIKRIGRFDYVIPVGPPPLERTLVFLERFLRRDQVPTEHVGQIISEFSQLFDNENVNVVDWHPTIDELNNLASKIAKQLDDSADVSSVVEQNVMQMAENPIIQPSQMEIFEADKIKYTYLG